MKYLIQFSCLIFICEWIVYFDLVIFLTILCIIGSSIHTCRRSGRHIVAFEEDALIFNALLQPLIFEKEGPVSKKLRVEEDSGTSDDDTDLDGEIPEIEATNLFCT